MDLPGLTSLFRDLAQAIADGKLEPLPEWDMPLGRARNAMRCLLDMDDESVALMHQAGITVARLSCPVNTDPIQYYIASRLEWLHKNFPAFFAAEAKES